MFLRRERKKCKKILSRTFKSNSSRPQGKNDFVLLELEYGKKGEKDIFVSMGLETEPKGTKLQQLILICQSSHQTNRIQCLLGLIVVVDDDDDDGVDIGDDKVDSHIRCGLRK